MLTLEQERRLKYLRTLTSDCGPWIESLARVFLRNKGEGKDFDRRMLEAGFLLYLASEKMRSVYLSVNKKMEKARPKKQRRAVIARKRLARAAKEN
jgi:hypothetical protein